MMHRATTLIIIIITNVIIKIQFKRCRNMSIKSLTTGWWTYALTRSASVILVNSFIVSKIASSLWTNYNVSSTVRLE